jgi:predicted metal-binding membrane protein
MMNTRRLEADSDRVFKLTAALIFVVSAAGSVAWCSSMCDMPGMAMPWARMPGQGALAHWGEFLGMWMLMMIAMMVPALTPMLGRYRGGIRPVRGAQRAALTASVALGYFAVWTLLGAVLFAIGTSLAEWIESVPWLAQAMPALAALVVLTAGALQFTAWKARQLACCRHSLDCGCVAPTHRVAWRHGLRIGARCVSCCSGLTAVLLAVGVMDLLAMILVTLAISAERLVRDARVTQTIGVALLLTGAALLLAPIIA